MKTVAYLETRKAFKTRPGQSGSLLGSGPPH